MIDTHSPGNVATVGSLAVKSWHCPAMQEKFNFCFSSASYICIFFVFLWGGCLLLLEVSSAHLATQLCLFSARGCQCHKHLGVDVRKGATVFL